MLFLRNYQALLVLADLPICGQVLGFYSIARGAANLKF
jgi:hypothetical protein